MVRNAQYKIIMDLLNYNPVILLVFDDQMTT